MSKSYLKELDGFVNSLPPMSNRERLSVADVCKAEIRRRANVAECAKMLHKYTGAAAGFRYAGKFKEAQAAEAKGVEMALACVQVCWQYTDAGDWIAGADDPHKAHTFIWRVASLQVGL